MKTRWDVPLLNQPPPELGEFFSNTMREYFEFEAEQQLKGLAKWERIRKLAELRRSCGAEPQKITISVGRPPRYT